MPIRANLTSQTGVARALASCDRERPAELWEVAQEVNRVRFTTLGVCAFCGVVKQGAHSQWKAVPDFAKEPAPYAVTNPALQDYAKDGENWWACPHCKKADQRLYRSMNKWLPFYADQYLTSLYSLHPLQGMLSSFLDISAHFANRCRSFLKGGFRPSNYLLD